jgi:hypothetical protein
LLSFSTAWTAAKTSSISPKPGVIQNKFFHNSVLRKLADASKFVIDEMASAEAQFAVKRNYLQ